MSAKDIFKQRLFTGYYSPGQRLKSERFYAKEFDLPQYQIRKALKELENEGHLVAQRGSGYFVKDSKVLNPMKTKGKAVFISKCIESGFQYFGYKLTERLQKSNIHLDCKYNISKNAEFDKLLTDIILSEEYDAAIIYESGRISWTNAFNIAKTKAFPLIFHDNFPDINVFAHIGTDPFMIGFLAAHKISDNHGQNPYYLGYAPEFAPVAELRLNGFMQGCKFFGLPKPEIICWNKGLEHISDEVEEKVLELLSQEHSQYYFIASKGFTDIFVRAFWHKTVNCQEKLNTRFIGSDAGRDFASKIPITCIIQDREQEIEEIARLLDEILDSGRNIICTQRLLNPKLIERDTI